MIDCQQFEDALSETTFSVEVVEQTVAGRPLSWSFYDARYRWVLAREWDDGPIMTFVMLNPSVATPYLRDMTDRRCEQFARREHCAGYLIVNLFAYRATEPRALLTAAASGIDIMGPGNMRVIRAAVEAVEQTVVVLAWGSNVAHPRLLSHARLVVAMLQAAGIDYYTLGTPTGRGQPRHPCRLAADTRLLLFGKVIRSA